MSTVSRQHHWSTDLFRAGVCLSGFTYDFAINTPSALTVFGHCDITHRDQFVGPFGYSSKLSLNRADTLAELGPAPNSSTPVGSILLPGSTNGGNVLNIAHHYGKLILNGYIELQPGFYRLLVHAYAHTSVDDNTRDDLAEVLVEGGKGLNLMVARLDPLAV